MTTPCANCGSPITEGAERCPVCDALAPLDDDATRIEAGPTTGSASPWAIPIRDPDVVATPGDDRTRRTVAFAALGAAVFLLTVVVAGAALRGDGGADLDRDEKAASSDRSTTSTTADAAGTSAAAASSTTAATEALVDDDSDDAEVAALAASTTTTTTAPPPPTTAASTQGTGSVPTLSSSFRGGWIAQLTSVPRSAGTGALEAAWRQLGADRDIVAARTDDWAGFRSGYWVLVHAGPFASADDVRAHCEATGRTDRDECLPRELARR